MAEPVRLRDIENPKARRKAAVARAGEYHEQQLRLLLEHVRQGFARLDSEEIGPFELDDLIHHYKRASQKLWSFCSGTGSSLERAALTLEFWSESGEPEPNWWEAGAPRRRRRVAACASAPLTPCRCRVNTPSWPSARADRILWPESDCLLIAEQGCPESALIGRGAIWTMHIGEWFVK